MTLAEKLTSAVRYMFQRGMMVYWLGAGIATFLLQHLLLSVTAQQLLAEFAQIQNHNSDDFLQSFNAVRGELLAYGFCALLITFFIIAKSLDAAKRVSEGDMDGTDIRPVTRIGWGAVRHFIVGSIVITLAMGMVLVAGFFIVGLLIGLLGATIGQLLITVSIILAMIILCYAMYASTLVFIETLSYRAMINPRRWKSKVSWIGKMQLVKIILMLFVLSFIAGIIAVIVDSIFGQQSVVADIFGQMASHFLTMISFVWLGFFVTNDANTLASTDKENVNRMLYGADTYGMSETEKQQFAQDIQQADMLHTKQQYTQAIALLEPYTRSDEQAVRHYPAYQRLYDWYNQHDTQSKHHALQARIIHIAAQGHERFYQLIDDALFELANENNAQIAANNVYPLAELALAHNQSDTVLALAKDFRKRQDNHPDVVKVYACAIKALMLKGNHDIAQDVASTMLQQYPNHPDINIIQALSDK